MFLSDVSIKRPVFATMLMVALVVLGIISYQRLAIDEYPDVTYPVVIVNTTFPGASPEVMMREISKPIEEAVNTTQGIKEVSSTSLEGTSIVRVQFHLGVDVAEARSDIQGKVARIRRQLPVNVDDPLIQTFDPNERPIMSIAVQSAERPIRELTSLTDEVIATRVEAISGVGGVNIVGGNARQIRVQLDPDAMRAYGVGPSQVIASLQRENQEVPAGRVRQGVQERLVRITGRVVDPASFGDIAVTVRNGVPIRLRDLGTVVDGAAERRTAAELDGVPAVSFEVQKISGSNTVAVADSVRAALVDLERSLPGDVKLTVIRDDSERIRAAVSSVQHELILGAVLTILIVYLFLNSWRSTVITGLTLPISIISAFFIMWVFGFTVNTMTLLALSLAIGLLIDDAIVVRENIVRHLEMGKDHVRASKEGTDEIGLAVLSTTLAVVAVFIPVAFMGGMIGRIFFQFGVTVAFAVLVSLFVSFTLTPMLSAWWGVDPHAASHHAGGRVAQVRQPRGLALAMRLQSAGVQTTIIEARDKPGGRAYYWEKDGHIFDGGPTMVAATDSIRTVRDAQELVLDGISEELEGEPMMLAATTRDVAGRSTAGACPRCWRFKAVLLPDPPQPPAKVAPRIVTISPRPTIRATPSSARCFSA